MPDPRKFVTNTDYPMPFLVYYATYQFTATANDYGTKTLAHGLPFTPLLIGQWSTNASFQPSYDIAAEIPSFSGMIPDMTITVCADSSNVQFVYSNYLSTDVTFYFRLTAFTPPDYAGLATAIDDNSPFKYNSDFNYMKIFMAGSIDVPANDVGTITHGLGYVTQCRVWYDLYPPSIFSPANTNINDVGLLGAQITEQTLELGTNLNFGAQAHKFYYHIYADEA